MQVLPAKLALRRLSPKRKPRAGAAVVEFAIVAPLLFLLVLGFIELGRALIVQQVLTNASRVGARQAITLTGDLSRVEAAVTDYTAAASISGVQVNVSPSPSTAVAGQPVTVTVSVPFASVSWLPTPHYLGEKTLNASSVMRKEGFQ